MINELLEKFYNGETTQKEEQQLLELLEENHAPGHEADLALLRSLNAPMPDFEAMARKASGSKTRKYLWFKRLEAAAAVVILLAAVGSYFTRPTAIMIQRELTVDEAREQTILALTALSNSVDRGMAEIEKLNNL